MNSFMQIAIEEAKNSGQDIPVGAVVVKDGKVISVAHNERELNKEITSHAEILAIQKAERILNNWRLDDCDLYVTLEPCPMCGWAILQSRIKNVYFGSYDVDYGAFSKVELNKISTFHPNIYGGIMEIECNNLLNDFFSKLRK